MHARSPPRDAAPRRPSPSPDPGTPRPAGRSSPGPRSRPAGLARRSPDPIPDPCPRAPFSGPRAARQVRTLSLLPKPSAGSEAQRRRLIRSRHPRSRGGGAAEACLVSPGLQAGDLQRPPGRGARGQRPRGHTCPRGPTHIRSGTSRRPSTIMSGRKSSLKAEVMFAAHPALGGRTGGGGARVRAAAGGETGRDRCARPPRGGRPSRHLSHSLPPALRQSPPKASAEATGCGAPGAASGGGAPRPRAAA